MSEAVARPTIDTVTAEVAAEILRHYLPDAALIERRHHIGGAIIAGARLLAPEMADVGRALWGCVDDIDEELLSQHDDRRGVTYALLAMVKAAVAGVVATVDLAPGKRTANQRLNQVILSEARPHFEALANQNIDIDIIVEEIARLRRGESRFVDQLVVHRRLEAFVVRHGTAKKAAAALKISTTFMSELRCGHRPVPDDVLHALGIEKVRSRALFRDL